MQGAMLPWRAPRFAERGPYHEHRSGKRKVPSRRALLWGKAGVAARAYLVTGFGSWLAGSDSSRKGSLSLREISGQNSRSTSKPTS